MVRLALHLFGTPRIELDQQSLLIRRRKAVALLAYLALTQRPHNRDALATLLFPAYDQTGARENLRRILSSLYSALNHAWLQIDRANVALAPTEELWIDVGHFRHLRANTRRHHHAVDEPCTVCLIALDEAAALYTDDFLCGFTLPDSPISTIGSALRVNNCAANWTTCWSSWAGAMPRRERIKLRSTTRATC